MPGPLPMELCERVVEATDNGEGTHEESAERFGIKRNALQCWLWRREETGGFASRAMGGDLPRRGVHPGVS